MRRAASSTLPFSFLHGITTDTESVSRDMGGGQMRATTTWVMQSLLKSGSRAQKRFNRSDNKGRYFGNKTILCVSSASKPASFNRFLMSVVESQFCSARGTFIPSHSAKVTKGSHRW